MKKSGLTKTTLFHVFLKYNLEQRSKMTLILYQSSSSLSLEFIQSKQKAALKQRCLSVSSIIFSPVLSIMLSHLSVMTQLILVIRHGTQLSHPPSSAGQSAKGLSPNGHAILSSKMYNILSCSSLVHSILITLLLLYCHE